MKKSGADPFQRMVADSDRGCECLSIFIFLISIVVGALILFRYGDEVIRFQGITIMGSWLALPGAFLTGLAILIIAPWALRMRV